VLEGKSRKQNERLPCVEAALECLKVVTINLSKPSLFVGVGIFASQDPAVFGRDEPRDLLVPGQATSHTYRKQGTIDKPK
jgi:hypothetical protein